MFYKENERQYENASAGISEQTTLKSSLQQELQESKDAIIRAMIHARHHAGLTQEELAERMGTSQSAIARLESGNQLPSLNTIFRYAEATGTVPVVELVNADA